MKFLTIAAAIEQMTGKRPHPVTCWRWSKKGIAGVKLQTWRVGGRRLTTLQAVQEFIEASTRASVKVAPQSFVSAKLRKELYSR